jgi:hypothetical protein
MKHIDPQWLSEQITTHGATVSGLMGTGYEGDILFIIIGGIEYGLIIDEILEWVR